MTTFKLNANFALIFLLLTHLVAANEDVREAERHAKLFSLFSVKRFANSPCTGLSGLNGTCFTAQECANANGVASGHCADGLGVCCTIVVTACGLSVEKSTVYWQNPGGIQSNYSATGQCLLYVKKTSEAICQLRLDFLSFNIQQPDSDGQCVSDSLVIHGAANPVPQICGFNSGQHVYVEAVKESRAWQFTINTAGSSFGRKWNIQISQLTCSDSLAAPGNCLQYFTHRSGIIQSFNYDSAAQSSVNTTRQLSDQDYTICIKSDQKHCGVSYTTCTDPHNEVPASFSISGSRSSSIVFPTFLESDCLNDWLMIPCATNLADPSVYQRIGSNPGVCVNKICGGIFSSTIYPSGNCTVYSYSKPFELRFFTDSTEISSRPQAETGNLGFCLKYNLLACDGNSKKKHYYRGH